MGIKLTGQVTHERMEYNKVFVRKMVTRQHARELEADPAIFDVDIIFHMYGVDAVGRMHIDPDSGVQRMPIRDYLSYCANMSAQGYTAPLFAFGANQDAIACIIAHHQQVTATITS